ncbi:MAG: M56 family metallopeptidase [Cyclobacteriaceae bacterium]
MIVYLVEFAILHMLFLLVYKILLGRETQLRFLRFFLLCTTVLSLTLPLIEIPSFAPIPTINLESVAFTFEETPVVVTAPTSNVSIFQILFLATSALFFLRLIYGLIQIAKFYLKSESDISFQVPIRRIEGLRNSFTFGRWIFIDPNYFENPDEIITHEFGHSSQLHSIDILIFNFLTVPFWCVPSVWIAIHELRKVHEFEADQFALRSADQRNYIKNLVHSTLKAHGLNLASSFDDAPTVQRLKFMKKMKKKVSPWKVGSIMAIVLISGAMFACEKQINDEVQKIASETTQNSASTVDLSAHLNELQEKNPGEEFVIVESSRQHWNRLSSLKGYDPNQIAKLVQVTTQVNDTTIVESIHMIFNERSPLLKQILELQEYADDVYKIVDTPASYPGGIQKWNEYLLDEMQYPRTAKEEQIEGNIFVQIIIEQDGSLSGFQVLKGTDDRLNEEAVRVIKASKNWIPGKVNNKPVRMKMVVPIKFRLQ